MRFFAVIFLLMLSAGAAQADSWHNILGSTWGWDTDEVDIEVLSDSTTGKLRVRHVRRSSSNCVSGFEDHLEIDGEIDPQSTRAVEKLLKKLPECQKHNGGVFANQVYLNSGGGDLRTAYALGRLFREYRIETVITGEQECASSCVIAFLGGKQRLMRDDAQMLFYAPYSKNGLVLGCSDSDNIAELQAYYRETLGGRNGDLLLNKMLNYCAVSSRLVLSSEATFNADGAKQLGITTH